MAGPTKNKGGSSIRGESPTANLYWKSGETTHALIPKPFANERAFEDYVFDNEDVLGGDITVIYRQIKTGSKKGIPDIIGIDRDGRVCIIELKNVMAVETVLPQIMGYAIWAETNLDSLKAIWLESTLKPDDIVPDWTNLDLRLIIIAPSFAPAMPMMASKIGYQVELLQVRRFGPAAGDAKDEWILTESLPLVVPQGSVTGGETPSGWESYRQTYDHEAVTHFRRAVEGIDEMVQRNGWNLQYNFNKTYVAFKLGGKIACIVSWIGRDSWRVECRVQQKYLAALNVETWQYEKYDKAHKEASFRPLIPEKANVAELEPILRAGYEWLAKK